MEQVPGVLFYKLSKYAELDIVPMMELFSTVIQNKLQGNLSAFQYLLIKQDYTQDRMSFRKCKQALKSGALRLISVNDSTKLIIYSIRSGTCTSLEITGLPATFEKFSTSWTQMNSNEILMGCGLSQNALNEEVRNKYTKKPFVHNRYSIISLKDASVIQTGEMSAQRKRYTMVKVQNLYYAVLGQNQMGKSEPSIDIFNHNTGEWNLKQGLSYNIGATVALEFKDSIYAVGEKKESKSGAIVQFDTLTLQHQIVFEFFTPFADAFMMLNQSLIIIDRPRMGQTNLITFEGDEWEVTKIDKEKHIRSYLGGGDSQKYGDYFYFINKFNEVCKVNLSTFLMEKVEELKATQDNNFILRYLKTAKPGYTPVSKYYNPKSRIKTLLKNGDKSIFQTYKMGWRSSQSVQPPIARGQSSWNPAQSIDAMKIRQQDFVQKQSGCIFDHYSIGKQLGEGADGQVTLGISRTSKNQYAIKSIKKPLDFDQENVKGEFLQEIEIVKNWDHPNIVKIYESYEDHRHIHIVTEVVQGGELFDYIRKNHRFSERTASHFMKQILEAICYLHRMGVVHRDLKPENLLLETQSDTSLIKIIDFGTSALYDPKKKLKTKKGTPYYTAPEVIKGSYDEKWDVWSCGVIMYIMLCGYPPFNGDTDDEILISVSKGKFVYPDEEWANVSQQARDLIEKMLFLNPKKRCSALQAAQHPWFNDLSPSTTEFNDTQLATLNNLKNFQAKYKLQKAVLTFITSRLVSAEDTCELRALFRQLDTDNDGRLSREELIEGYAEILGSQNAAVQEASNIMENADIDKSGYLDYTEFLIGSSNKATLLSNLNLESAFKAFDIDGSGTITTSEVKTMLGEDHLKEDLWQELINEVDQDKNGVVDIHEFKDMMLKIF